MSKQCDVELREPQLLIPYSHNSDGEGKDEFVRVDASGHLVNSDGLVLHPAKDKQYEYTRVINGDVGKVKYKLGDVVGITVENKNYRVRNAVQMHSLKVSGRLQVNTCKWIKLLTRLGTKDSLPIFNSILLLFTG